MAPRPPRAPSFVVACCAAGAEPWLKAEVAREHPALRPSFSRPGLVTFKGDVEPDALRSVFARVVASSVGPVENVAAVAQHLRGRAAVSKNPLRLFVHAGAPRHRAEVTRGLAPADRDLLSGATRGAIEAEIRLLVEGHVTLAPGALASDGDRVVDVFTAPGEEPWLAEHVHAAPMQPWAAGASPLALPPDAPSRAYLKLEEALLWSGLPVREGDRAVEIGSAPGGASLALLRRGVDVIGVDPGEMAPVVLAYDRAERPVFSHRKVPIGALKKNDLPQRIDWVALDVNLAPPVALRYLERVTGPRQGHLLGAILTLKLNDAAMAAKIPSLLVRVRAMGFSLVRATQLPTNRSEICVVALSARGASRAAKAERPSRRGSSEPTPT